MKILLYGKNAKELASLATSLGLTIVEDRPDVIVSYGGDGTLLASERKYPGLPKLPIRDSNVCRKCENHTSEKLLEALAKNTVSLHEHPKLSVTMKDIAMQALNDVVIRNSYPIHAMRFSIMHNNSPLGDEVIIGDGVVAATPFGASGYYHSITKQDFTSGFGLAFNNTTKELAPLHFPENDTLTIEVIRGPAVISVDNNPEMPAVQANDTIIIKASEHKTKIYQLETLRCKDCVVSREKRLAA